MTQGRDLDEGEVEAAKEALVPWLYMAEGMDDAQATEAARAAILALDRYREEGGRAKNNRASSGPGRGL